MHPINIVKQIKTDIVKIVDFQETKKTNFENIAHEIFRIFPAIGMGLAVAMTARLFFIPNRWPSKIACAAFFILFHDSFVIAINNQKGFESKVVDQVEGIAKNAMQVGKETIKKITKQPSKLINYLYKTQKEISKPVPAYFLSKNTLLSMIGLSCLWNAILPREGFSISK